MSETRFYRLLFSPVSVFILIWFSFLLFYSLKIIDFGDLNENFRKVFWGGVVGFLFGSAWCTIGYHSLFKNTFSDNARIIRIDFPRFRKLFYISFCIGSLGVLLSYYYLFNQVSLQYYFTHSAEIKTTVNRSVLFNYLSYFSFISVILGTFLYLETKRKFYLLTSLLLTFAYSMSFWGRFPFFVGIIILISPLMVNKSISSKNKLKNPVKFISRIIIRLFLVFLLTFAFLSWTIHFRVQQYGENYNPYGQKIEEPILHYISPLFGSELAMRITYGYLTAPLATLNYWTNMDSEYLNGQASFPYLYRFLNKIGLYNDEIIKGDEVIGGGLQLPTLFGSYYRDFGLLGVIIFLFFSGFFSQLSFLWAYSKTNFLSIAIYSLVMVYLIMSPLINIFSEVLFIILFFYIIITNFFIRVRL